MKTMSTTPTNVRSGDVIKRGKYVNAEVMPIPRLADMLFAENAPIIHTMGQQDFKSTGT